MTTACYMVVFSAVLPAVGAPCQRLLLFRAMVVVAITTGRMGLEGLSPEDDIAPEKCFKLVSKVCDERQQKKDG